MGVLEWFSNPLLTDVLDVIVVACLVYWILLLLRGTRALPMLAGLGILVLLYLFSRVLNLVTLNWLLGNFLGSAILVIVVLFQDDLRRALIKVGLGPGFGSAAGAKLDKTLKDVAKAAAVLSARRIGALMVIQRDIGLADYTEAAVPVDALVSYQLLTSIFHPASPIHDGAIVVDRDRIVAAGIVLPLTFNPSAAANLGTRHRAALGLSERTDALIVVVSEESGSISLAREGRITRELSETTLYNALHRLTIFRAERRKRAKEKRKKRAVLKPLKAESTHKEITKSSEKGKLTSQIKDESKQ